MKYISTRGNAPALDFEAVVTSGLAPDGGLYMPESTPQFSKKEISSWTSLSYQELAEKVMAPYMADAIPADDLKHLIEKSYSTFRTPTVAPLHKLSEKAFVLELFHGPTLAFKDIALQFLGNVLDYLLDRQKQDVVIIGATSGDTGSAAIAGCKACKHVQLFMLHPDGRVSDVQRRQMTTVHADNIHNLAVQTNFDGCQTMVKEMFQHPDFLEGKQLVAVNSINWARIMAQIVYYFYAALKLDGPDKPLSFSVPTGNFGDIFAGYMAHKMGLPIEKLIIATNTNDILHRFLTNNDYRQTGVTPTLSPSMDIQISSNFERLLFDLYDRDGTEITNLMDQFKSNNSLSVRSEILDKARTLFASHRSDDEATKAMITQLHSETNYLVDPHTATGIAAARACQDDIDSSIVILSTAHPAKFPHVAIETLGITPELPSHLADLMTREERFKKLPDDIDAVKAYIKEES